MIEGAFLLLVTAALTVAGAIRSRDKFATRKAELK